MNKEDHTRVEPEAIELHLHVETSNLETILLSLQNEGKLVSHSVCTSLVTILTRRRLSCGSCSGSLCIIPKNMRKICK